MNDHSDLFTTDYKDQPYWWDRTPRPQLAEQTLPQRTDVAIIGSGYTGLCAAMQTARGGRDTLVLDAEDAGWGCSSRNGGQISTSIKPGYADLVPKYGADHAARIVREGQRALAWIGEFIDHEDIDCDFRRAGRFYAAHNPAKYEMLALRYNHQPKGLEVEAHMLPKAEQHREIGSDVYYGGVVLPQHAALDPARFHQALLERAQIAGVKVQPHCAVTAIDRDGSGFVLTTARGKLAARDVIVATNGYTGSLTPWLQRRVIPIGSYIIATEALPEGLMHELIPNDRVLTDTRKLVYYYRASPDRTRILFGGRVSLKETDPRVSAPRLHAELVRIFPQLKTIRVSHSWVGFVAYTFDEMPHLGCHEGISYAMGYCGSGVSLASYFGTRLGQQLLGLDEGKTALDGVRFQTRPLYNGNPWFLAPSIRYYRWQDRKAG
jgi:glycine/D-amino acid oxidase-like deaminating enzyme